MFPYQVEEIRKIADEVKFQGRAENMEPTMYAVYIV